MAANVIKKLPIGISDFKEIIENNYCYVDKTLLIKEIIDDGSKVLLLPRPRRFGKTLNLSMLYYFFSDKEHAAELFNNTHIAHHDEYMHHQGNYPVIFLTFKDIKKETFAECLQKIKELISSHVHVLTKELYQSLTPKEKQRIDSLIDLTASNSEYETSLKYISDLFYKHLNKKVVILIDEYDAPIHSALSYGYYTEFIIFIRNLLSEALKDNSSLYVSIVTGILRTTKEGIFSGLNNLRTCTILDEIFSDKFGFTQSEVTTLLSTYNLSNRFAIIKEWYNGYTFGSTTMYNPWSIIMCITNKGNLDTYWANTSENKLVTELIAHADDSQKTELESLIQNKSIVKEISSHFTFPITEDSEKALWSMLLFTGYLSYASRTFLEGSIMYELILPNKEIIFLYNNLLKRSFENSLSSTGIKKLREAFIKSDSELLQETLQKHLLTSISL